MWPARSKGFRNEGDLMFVCGPLNPPLKETGHFWQIILNIAMHYNLLPVIIVDVKMSKVWTGVASPTNLWVLVCSIYSMSLEVLYLLLMLKRWVLCGCVCFFCLFLPVFGGNISFEISNLFYGHHYLSYLEFLGSDSFARFSQSW